MTFKKIFRDEEILDLYKKGLSTTEVMLEVRCSHATVKRILKKNGIKTKPHNRDGRLRKMY